MTRNDIDAATRSARKIVSTAASIFGLLEIGQSRESKGVRRLMDDLADALPPNDDAIMNAAAAFHRDSAFRLGDVVAPSAHEAAIELGYALNRQIFGFEIIGRKAIRSWPFADELLVEIGLEHERALSAIGQGSSPGNARKRAGRKTSIERDQAIAEEYREGLENGKWEGQSDYLRQRHQKKWHESDGAAKAWLSTLLKRVELKESPDV